MFKGIKKRFSSARAVHPSDLIVNPHSRRSLERGGGLSSPCSGKSPPTPGTPGGGVLLPDEPQGPLHHSAYPITPNLVVTGGKIEFITPPGSTLSSQASGNSTLKLSPTSTLPHNQDILPHDHNTTLQHTPLHHHDHIILNNNNINASNTNNANNTLTTTATIITTSLDSPTTPTKAKESGSSKCSGSSNNSSNSSNNTSATASPSPTSKTRTLPLFPSTPTTTTTTTTSLPSPPCRTTTTTATTTTTTRSYSASFKRKNNRHVEEDDETTTDDFDDDVQDESNTKRGVSRVSHSNSRNISSQSRPRSGPPHASNRRRHHIRGSDMAAKEGGNGTGKNTVVALRQENQQVKNRLTFLQQEFATLEQQVRALVSDRRVTAMHQEEQREQREATEAAYLAKLTQYQQTIQELEDSLEEAPISHNQDLVKLSERCTSLESANATLAMEARLQQQQYERCLDHIASHLVQALLNQKTIQQQRLKMAHQLRDLQRQNAALTSLVRRGGSDPSTTMPSCHHQLRHRHHKTHPSLEQNTGFYSLPSSPSKIKATGWVESWHLEESSNSHLSDALTSFLDTTDPQDLSQGPIESLGEAIGGSQTAAVHLQEAAGCCVLQTLTTTGTTTTTTTTTACWYDIINTLNSGTGPSANNTGNLGGMRLSCLTSSQSVSSWSQADGLNHLEGTFVSISSCSSSPTATPPSQSPRQPPHSVLFPHPHSTLVDGSQLEPQTSLRLHAPNTGVAAAVSRLPSSYLSPESSAASLSSKFFPLSPESLGATSSTTSIEHKPLCPGFTREEKVMISKVDTTLSPRDIVEQLLEKDNASQKLNNLNKSDVTCVLSAIESEVSISGVQDYHRNLEAIVSEKGKDNLNISKVDVKSLMVGVKVHNNSIREEAVGEISTTRDEGYSTMSSDVQAEVKDSVTTTCSVTTVEEESTSLNISANREMTTVTTSNSGSNSISREVASIANVENCEEKTERKDNIEGECNGNAVNQTTKVISDKNDNCILKESKKIISINKSRPTEYSDGLRVVYDMENSNPDIFFLPIPDPENAQLYRHSYDNSQAQERVTGTGRWYSDSQLYVHKMAKDKAKVITSNAEKKLDIIDLSERAASEVLRRCNSKNVLQALPKTEVVNGHGHEGMFIDTESEGEDERRQRMAENSWLSKERRFLSPTYSHAELEDWDLDLSSECLVSNGGDIEVATEEHSEATSVSGAAHQGSVPSLQQEATPDLEEDSNDFLWNGATYLKEDLLEGGELKDDPNHPNWSASSKKDLEHWHLTDKDHQQHQVLLSPRSGCSDQPADRWSSSEQLSCCSEGFSVRSSDFENFCEQLCTLPELKRVSFCSSEAGGGREGAAPEGQVDDDKDGAAPSSNCSMEDGDEFGDELNIDTVFTRDFYRLVKFESIKSLAASSKSLATNDGILTLEKLKDLEASGVRKETLASVLGFIAEQQKYCQEREAQDSAPKPRDDPYRTLGAISSSELAKQAALTNGAFSQNSPLHAVAKDSRSRSSLDRRTLPTKSKLASSACLASNQARSSQGPSTSTTNSTQTPTPVSSTGVPTCTPTPAPRKVGPPVPAKPRSSSAQPRIPVCSQASPMRCPPPPCPPGYNRSSLPPPCPTQVPHPPPHRGQFPPRPSSMIAFHNAHPPLSSLPPPVPLPLVPPPPAALQRNSSRIYSAAGVMVSDLYSVPPDEVFDMPPPPPCGIGSELIPSCMLPEGPAPPVPRRSSSMSFATQQGPLGSATGAPPVKPHLTNPNESPPVPKRVTSRALPPLPSEMMPGYSHLTPGSSHSLETPRCSGVTSAESRRPLSFIKDTFGMGGPRRSNSDPQSLPGFSNQSPAGMLLELQRMAQVEEEEEEAVVKETSVACRTTTMSKSDEHLYEPGSPVDNVGLGTGWVRVEPSHVDLQDPQARANLLDGMMESSEGCSSGTEDDDGAASAAASNNPQHSQLRHLHRNRRKKKASLRSGGQVGPPAASRPSILGRQDLFTRYGDKEMAAIQEFDFLTQHSSTELLESGELTRKSNPAHDVGSGKESAQLGELMDPFEKSERMPQESPKSASDKDESKVSTSNTLSSQYGRIIPKNSTSCQSAVSKAAPVTVAKNSLCNPKNSHTSKHTISNLPSNSKHPTTSQITTKHPTANHANLKQSSIIPSPSPNTAIVRQPSPTTQLTQRQPTFLASPPRQLTPRSTSPRNTSSKQTASNQQSPNQKSTKQRSPRQVASRQSYPNHTSCSSYAPPSEAALCRRIPSPVESSSVPTSQSDSFPSQTPTNVSSCQTFPSHHPSFILLQQSHPPLAKPSRKSYSRNISVEKSCNVKKPLCYEKEKSKCEVDSSKCEKDTMINIEDQKNVCEMDTINNSDYSNVSIEYEGVDTRKMGSVRSTINQLNKINTFSGIKQPATPLPSLNTTATTSTANTPTTSLRSASTTTNINIPTSNSSLVNNNNYDNINSKLVSSSNYNSKNNLSTNKLRANTPRFKVFNRQEGTSDSSGSSVAASGGKSANTKGNKLSPPRLTVDTSRRISGGGASPELQEGSKSSSPTRIPRVGNPLSSSSKKQTTGSVSNHNQSSKMVANSGSRSPSLSKRSLPPKGLTGSSGKSPNGKSGLHSRNRTGGTSPGVKLSGGQQQGSNNKNIIPSPRLARLRNKGISDPLDAFIGKSLCDSGSSEGSERCGGRLSLSDSCAENFSPIDSGDEVFDKIS